MGRRAHLAPAPLPVGETGGSKRRGAPSGGGSPAGRAARRAGLHKRMADRKNSGCERARKTGETARVGAGISRCFTLARARGGAPWFFNSEKKRMGGALAETTRGSRDRLEGQPQERQHSAAEGGTRDRRPPASDSRAISRRVGINFAFVISSQCCACRSTACACSLSQFFIEDDMAKKAKKAKKTAKAATKKVAKKTSKKKK